MHSIWWDIREIRLWFTPCARKTDKLVSSVVAPSSQIRGLASESLEQTPNASHRPRMKHTYSTRDWGVRPTRNSIRHCIIKQLNTTIIIFVFVRTNAIVSPSKTIKIMKKSIPTLCVGPTVSLNYSFQNAFCYNSAVCVLDFENTRSIFFGFWPLPPNVEPFEGFFITTSSTCGILQNILCSLLFVEFKAPVQKSRRSSRRERKLLAS